MTETIELTDDELLEKAGLTDSIMTKDSKDKRKLVSICREEYSEDEEEYQKKVAQHLARLAKNMRFMTRLCVPLSTLVRSHH